MEFYPSPRQDFSNSTPEEVARWADEQFRVLAEALQSTQQAITLYPTVVPPTKYMDGTVCNFAEGTAVAGYSSPGLYVYHVHDSSWHKLEEL